MAICRPGAMHITNCSSHSCKLVAKAIAVAPRNLAMSYVLVAVWCAFEGTLFSQSGGRNLMQPGGRMNDFFGRHDESSVCCGAGAACLDFSRMPRVFGGSRVRLLARLLSRDACCSGCLHDWAIISIFITARDARERLIVNGYGNHMNEHMWFKGHPAS